MSAVARGRCVAALRATLAGLDATARLFSRCGLPFRSDPQRPLRKKEAVRFGRRLRGPGRRIEIPSEIGRRASRSSGGRASGHVDGRGLLRAGAVVTIRTANARNATAPRFRCRVWNGAGTARNW